MTKIKILLSSRPKLLSDVIRDLIERQPDMEVIGEVRDPMQLLIATQNTVADAVIITPLKLNGEPRICRKLLTEHPYLMILTLQADTDAATIYRLKFPPLHFQTLSSRIILNVLRGGSLPAAS
ncbi:MAG: response regulator transcription factor [Candidatus Marinimicrobia bacterium]|nr:response regulator transcription factor [Candidatus Neomarinimicrobiota bacterium]